MHRAPGHRGGSRPGSRRPRAPSALPSDGVPGPAEAAGERDGRIVPDVTAIATVAPELDGIEMRGAADSVHEDELVLRPVERPHACIALVPDTNVQKRAIDASANSR